MSETQQWDILYKNANLFTAHSPIILQNAALAVQGEKIAWIGSANQLHNLTYQADREIDLFGAWIAPGLIDCHTHLVYAGNRAAEFAQRLAGKSYQEIAAAGGGIASTVKATRAASEEELFYQSAKRLQCWLDQGVTTVEIKSGYGLDVANELKLLKVAQQLAEQFPVTIQKTFLGAHALPLEFKHSADDYIEYLCDIVMPKLIASNLIDAVDVFCEKIGFNLLQTEKIFRAAQQFNLPIKCHAEQLSDQKAAVLAARYHALSVDHLEYLDPQDVPLLKKAKTVAVLLPGAFYFLGETKLPPIAALNANTIPLAIATDANPGTSPTTSLLLMLNMACTFFRLTPEQALLGVTINAAKALGLAKTVGSLEVGKHADLSVWDVDHIEELAYRIGDNPCIQVVKHGKIVLDKLF
ncbi:MAG: imidazolonepropionase [Legionellales bacterium]|nr:imidazolonepropionase [Legionellales bacterium]